MAHHEPKPIRSAWSAVERVSGLRRNRSASVGHDAKRLYTPAGKLRDVPKGPKRSLRALRDATRFTDPSHVAQYAALGWTVTQCTDYYLAFPPKRETKAKAERPGTALTEKDTSRLIEHQNRLSAILADRVRAAMAYKPGFAG